MSDTIDKDLYRKVEHEILLQAVDNLPVDYKIILNSKINEILNNHK